MSRGAADSIEIAEHTRGPREVIVVGIPTFGMVSVYFMGRLYNLRMPMNRIVRQVYCVGKEVGDARNEIVSKALQIEQDDPTMRCSKILFLDDDVLCHQDALLKLLSHNRPIVSGLYYTKSAVPTPLVLHGEFGGTATSWTPGDLVECWAHGMGLTLVDAEVFRRLRDETDLGVDKHGYPAWFKTTRDDALVKSDGTPAITNQTEDVYFLRRAASLGYAPAVDTSFETFGWHFDHKTFTAYPSAQWREFCAHGTVTWGTGESAVTWGAAA